MKHLFLVLALAAGCSKPLEKKCPKPQPPKFVDLCINGLRVWQDMDGKRGLMVELQGFKPVKCD